MMKLLIIVVLLVISFPAD
ncbi:type I toxin-antitoxin system Ibs family toxin [Escherichia coli]|nr:type I toxin-antitoxin system Ibs family toxin [Escherichia coli]